MKQTRILIDCHKFDENYEGTVTYIKGLYKEMIKNKNYLFYFVSYNYDLSTIFGVQDNIIYLRYNSKNKWIRLMIDLPFLILKNKIDFAHFQYIVPPIKFCKYIVTIHDLLFLEFKEYYSLSYILPKKILYKLSTLQSEIVLTVSEYSKKKIDFYFKSKNVIVTPNAVDDVFFEEFDKIETQKNVFEKFKIENYFLFVSRWELRKNHYTLLKVFVDNKLYEKYNLVFVGKKDLITLAYDSYFSQLPQYIQDKIFTFNKVSFDDLVMINRAAEVSIYPSLAEGFGIPPLESLATGVPTICSNTTAMSDFNFMSDYLFDPTNEKEMYDKICYALHQKINLKEAIKQKYNWQFSAKQLDNEIRKNNF